MPIPKPTKTEKKSDFISRCIAEISDEYEQSQAAGICYNSYKENEKMSRQEEMFVLQPKKTENRGMYLSRCSNNARMKSQIPDLKKRMGFCLNSFNEYYAYWKKIDMAQAPVDTTLGECIAREKSKGFDYKEAYAHCSTKIGSQPLMPGQSINLEKDLLIEPVEFGELDIYGYPTEYFYICPFAQKLFQHLIEMGGDEDTKRMVRNAAILADSVFGIEADVLDEEIADEKQVAKAELLVKDFYELMKVIDEKVKMNHDVLFMDGHIEKIKSYL